MNAAGTSISHSQAFADFAQACVLVRSHPQFVELIEQHVQPLLPHRMLLAVIGRLSFDHLQVRQHIAIGYSDAALSQLTQSIHIRERPLLQHWLRTRAPVVACPVEDAADMSLYEHAENTRFGLGRLALHGLPDLTSRMGTYFSFAQVTPEIDSAIIQKRLQLIVPLLHTALLQACQLGDLSQKVEPSIGAPSLTPIERELLVWLAAGRSNNEIAAMRQRSPATVRNQLVKLYDKLGVSTRAEAVAWVLSREQIV